MEQPIGNILMPVSLTEDFLPVIKQVGQLAKEHDAKLHLLFTSENRLNELVFPWARSTRSFVERKEAWSTLNLWQYMIEALLGIKVEIHIPSGNWRKMVLHYAAATSADLIVLHEKATPVSWHSSPTSHLQYIIKRSPCQVITLFALPRHKANWQQVVIPVTNFVPELRINTIIKTAVTLNLKVHLIALGSGESTKQENDFHFLTETLKRLKPVANIQVECRCLENGYGQVDSFLKYARSIGADLLMTRMSAADKETEALKEVNLFMI